MKELEIPGDFRSIFYRNRIRRSSEKADQHLGLERRISICATGAGKEGVKWRLCYSQIIRLLPKNAPDTFSRQALNMHVCRRSVTHLMALTDHIGLQSKSFTRHMSLPESGGRGVFEAPIAPEVLRSENANIGALAFVRSTEPAA